MSNFRFDPTLPPDANIAAFFEHLEARDPEMTRILIDNLGMIHPLPEAAAIRSTNRKIFHETVLRELKRLAGKPKADK